MNLTPLHLAALLAVVALLAAAVVLLVARRSRKVDPVYCIHCWVHNKQVTVVTHSTSGRPWAICQECVGLYWDFDDSEGL